MNFLEERIAKDGVVKPGNVLKVDSFLNHQMDIALTEEIGREFKRRFAGKPITKVLTIESSGIAIACSVARELGVPVVFAKKAKSDNIENALKVIDFFHDPDVIRTIYNGKKGVDWDYDENGEYTDCEKIAYAASLPTSEMQKFVGKCFKITEGQNTIMTTDDVYIEATSNYNPN